MKTSILLLSVVLFTGCTTSSIFNNLNVGMTKKEAIAAVGEPENTGAKDNLEYLNYSLLGV